MKERITTSNGYEIEHPSEKLTAEAFRTEMSETYGINGETPAQRIEQLKNLSTEGIAIMLEDINKGVQGSETSLMYHDGAMKIGEQETIHPEDRYDVFTSLIDTIKQTPDTINPARIADALALGVVLLHPFHDGNGRTARAVGLMFRDHYDGPGFESDYDTVVEARNDARARGGFLINGYVPQLPEGAERSDPVAVNQYLTDVLQKESPGAYSSCFGQAPLYAEKPE